MLLGLLFQLGLKCPLTAVLYFLCPFRLSRIPSSLFSWAWLNAALSTRPASVSHLRVLPSAEG